MSSLDFINNDLDDRPWWQGAVIYQIYPRSFYDSNGDGVGDLPGITEKLDYVASLGVDAVWISPFFTSPMKDFGYDVSDYCNVDPLFGSLQDFDALVAKAHRLGLKVIIDQVLSHTSDQHRWFQESRCSRDNDKADWYVWADAKPDGSPPNNWLSVFGGGAWQWHEPRQQYYFHNFLKSQPDLNFHCEAMRRQLLKQVEFWLQRGVDGLRLDAINFCFHDAQLRDNPKKPMAQRKARGFSSENPYAAQRHLYDNTQPENLKFLEELRALLDKYPQRMSLGEINSEDSLATTAEYTAGSERLHMGYSFELLSPEFSADYIRKTVATLNDHLPDGWPCWAFSNHDVMRVVSRWCKAPQREEFAKMALALLSCLKGTLCVYQGEELGLPEAEIAQHQLQDPFGIEFWPAFKGRDGCRTPMPWKQAAKYAGFSEGESTWLPVPDEHKAMAVDCQRADSNSVLNFAKGWFAWRAQQAPLVTGDMRFIDSPDGVLGFVRGEQLLCYFNLENRVVDFPAQANFAPLQIPGCSEIHLMNQQTIHLPAYGFALLEKV